MLRKTLLSLAVVGAQLAFADDAAAKPPAEWGGFGYFTVGGFMGDWSSLESDLDDEEALGPFFDINPLALHVGGGGKALLGQWVLLGAKGMGWFLGGDERDGAEVGISGGGGGIDIGIAAFNRHDTLFYPYIGVAGYALSVDVVNGRDVPFRFGSGAVAAGQEGRLTSAYLTADFGLGIQRMMFFGEPEDLGDGGLLFGFEGGLLTRLVDGGFSDGQGGKLSGVSDFGVSGVYLRLTIGAGGFTFSDDPRYQEGGVDYEDDELEPPEYDDY